MKAEKETIPATWLRTTLGEIAWPGRPKEHPHQNQTLPFIGMADVESKTTQILQTSSCTEMNSNGVHFQPGDVLYGRLRSYLNKVCCPDFEGLCSAELIVFPKRESLASKFLLHLLNTSSFVSFASHLNEGDRPRVDYSQIADYEVLLPPLPEQHRIVAELEKQFTRLSAAEAALSRVQANLKRYRASVLKAACEGRLVPTEAELARKEGRKYETGEQLLKRILAERRRKWEEAELEKMRAAGREPKDDGWKKRYQEPAPPDTTGLPELPEGWLWASMNQMANVVRGGSPRPAGDPRYFGGAIPWITVGPITADTNTYLESVPETVTEEGKARSRYIEPHTLLLTNSGATLGVPKISRIGGCINDGVAALLDVDYPLKLYLLYFLHSQTSILRGVDQGAAQPNLNTTIIKSIMVPLPPLQELERITAEIERRIGLSTGIESRIAVNLRYCPALRQSILKRAFEGRLVPQNPADEPASLLLERIRAEREAHRKSEITNHKSQRNLKSQISKPDRLADHPDRASRETDRPDPQSRVGRALRVASLPQGRLSPRAERQREGEPPGEPPRPAPDRPSSPLPPGEGGGEGVPRADPRIVPEAVLPAFRRVLRGRGWIAREDLITEAAVEIGLEEMDPASEAELSRLLDLAEARRILFTNGGRAHVSTASIRDYGNDELVGHLMSTLSDHGPLSRDELLRLAAAGLGFSRLREDLVRSLDGSLRTALREGIAVCENGDLYRLKRQERRSRIPPCVR